MFVRYLVPDLEPHCSSWIVVDRRTGKAVLETFNPKIAKAVNQERYEVLTALQYLSDLSTV